MIYSNKKNSRIQKFVKWKVDFQQRLILIFSFRYHFTSFAFKWAYSHIRSRRTSLFLEKEAKERKILKSCQSGNDFGVPKMWTLQNTGIVYLSRLRPKHLWICPPSTDHRTTAMSQWWATSVRKVTTFLGTRKGTLYLFSWHCKMGVPCQSPCPGSSTGRWTRNSGPPFWLAYIWRMMYPICWCFSIPPILSLKRENKTLGSE